MRASLRVAGVRLVAPALFCWGLAAVAAAQEDDVEEVVVTGSYIRGSAEDAASPVRVLQRDEIVASGVSDMSEMIKNLDIASGSDTAPVDGARFNGGAGSGLANVNLRGLGPTSTLVLLDGKRLPEAGQKLADGDRFVDINSIPITMIERVEVLKDGGSAIYGSDAIAGVVNFITRSTFEGFELTGKLQSTQGEDQDDSTIGAIYGWASESERTHFVIGGEYFDRTHERASEREDLHDYYPKQSYITGLVNRSFFPDPQCEDLGFYYDNWQENDPTACNRNGITTDTMIPAQERHSAMAVFSHEFSPAAEVYGQMSYMHTQSGERDAVHVGPIEPKYFFPSLLGSVSLPVLLGGTVPWSTNPFTGGAPGDPSVLANGGPLPAAAIPGIVALPLDLVDWTMRTPGLEADREWLAGNNQDTTRFQVGVRGDFDIGERSWHYDASITRGDSQFETNFLGIDKNRLELAMYGLGGPDCVPNGSIAVGDPRADVGRFLLAGADGVISQDGPQGALEPVIVAVSGGVPNFSFINPDNLLLAMTSDNIGTGGCQFYNPYLTRADDDPRTGAAFTNSEELLRWIETPVNNANDTETFLTSADLVFSGDLVDMAHGTVAMAFGLQYREEGRKTTVNPIFIGSVNSFGQQIGGESVAGLSENRNFDEDRDIYAAFLEFQIPLFENVDVQLAGRYEDYGSDIGDTFDPKLGIRWQALPSLVLRASASTSFRGPAISQVEEGTGYSLEFGVLDRLGERGDAIALANGPNCARTGQCALPDDAVAPRIIIVKRGQPSPDLQPEEAVTYNFGAIWSPQEGALQGLTIGIDYYNIELEDKIIDVPTQAFLTTELEDFNAAFAAGDFTIVEPTAGDFGQPCDPLAPEFSYAADGVRAEQCQVNPLAYDSPSITRRTDLSRDLQIIQGPAINTGKVVTNGIDADIAYLWETDDWGAFVASASVNWVREYEVSDFPVGQPDFDAAGFTNRDPQRRLARSMPDLKGSAGLDWMRGVHSAGVLVRFVGEYHDNSAEELRFTDSFDPYYAVDVRYGYTFEFADDSALDLTVGAIDLFDANLPKVKDSRLVDLSVFDQRGLRLYGSLTYRM